MPPLSLTQTIRFFSSAYCAAPASSISPRWRQSMQMRWIEPSTLWATRLAKAEDRKAVNSAHVISPEAIANSLWRILPSPLTLPPMATL
jgi:hypothetical protein